MLPHWDVDKEIFVLFPCLYIYIFFSVTNDIPASKSNTEALGSSDNLLARTQPLLPAPQIM